MHYMKNIFQYYTIFYLIKIVKVQEVLGREDVF